MSTSNARGLQERELSEEKVSDPLKFERPWEKKMSLLSRHRISASTSQKANTLLANYLKRLV